MRFLVYLYYMQSFYRTSTFDQNHAYCIQIFMVCRLISADFKPKFMTSVNMLLPLPVWVWVVHSRCSCMYLTFQNNCNDNNLESVVQKQLLQWCVAGNVADFLRNLRLIHARIPILKFTDKVRWLTSDTLTYLVGTDTLTFFCVCGSKFFRFVTKHACDRRMDRRTELWSPIPR